MAKTQVCPGNTSPIRENGFPTSEQAKRDEILRARELLLYYTPPSPRNASPETFPEPSLENEPADGVPRNLLKSSDDPALMAFSQLLAIKLNCERSMISLFDQRKQYILAEATPTMPITDSTYKSVLHEPDGLWLGCETIPLDGSLCFHTIQLFPAQDGQKILEVHDLSQDPRFQSRDYVLNFPYFRFYAGTPLRTKGGFNIGTLCVLDSKPRHLTAEERETLVSMGRLVMRHYELTAERRAVKRSRCMAETLGLFSAGKDTSTAGSLEQPELSKDQTVQDTFTRASRLIREGLSCDGVVVLDASKTSFGKSADHETREYLSSWNRGVLGCDFPITWEGVDKESTTLAKIPSHDVIQKILKLYPHGKILNFDGGDGLVIHSGHDERAGDIHEDIVFRATRNFLPDCSSVLLYPIGHADSKPYAVAMCWVSDPRRLFTPTDFPFLYGFAGALMTAVAAHHTRSADNAKGEFINNISHELRSPLHGVLAAAELLIDTDLGEVQRGLINTVEICGRMLLDTINQILDFQKGSNMLRDHWGSRALGGGILPASLPRVGVVSPFEDTDLVALVEEVVDGAYAGHKRFASSHSEERGSTRQTEGSPDPLDSSHSPLSPDSPAKMPVAILLDFVARDSWVFKTQHAAFRRVLINLFSTLNSNLRDIELTIVEGNALKYTEKGWIRVQLRAEDEIDSNKSRITLSVSDSGRGMSQEFLKTKLFAPFSQEDSLSSGTGLGLSIVQQILHLIGGEINVVSDLGVGTEVVVTVVKERAFPSPPVKPKPFSAHGRSMCLRGIIDAPPGGALNAPVSLVDLLSRYAKDWMGMKLVETSLADVVVADEACFVPNLVKPMVVLCEETVKFHGHKGAVSFVRKPCGPLKLAKAVKCALERSTQADVFQGNTSDDALDSQHRQTNEETNQITTAEHPDITSFKRALNFTRSTPAMAYHAIEPGQNQKDPAFDENWPGNATQYAFEDREEDTSFRKGRRRRLVRMDSGRTSVRSASEDDSQAAGLFDGDREDTPGGGVPLPDPVLPFLPNVLSTVNEEVEDFKPNVLIVEDNMVNAMLLSKFLAKKKYPHSKASNGLVGFEAVKAASKDFDIILMDLQMPIMSGFESTRAIREYEAQSEGRVKRSVIIALTGLAGDDDRREAYHAGVDLFLTKPVKMAAVDKEIEKWKKEKRLEKGPDRPTPTSRE